MTSLNTCRIASFRSYIWVKSFVPKHYCQKLANCKEINYMHLKYYCLSFPWFVLDHQTSKKARTSFSLYFFLKRSDFIYTIMCSALMYYLSLIDRFCQEDDICIIFGQFISASSEHFESVQMLVLLNVLCRKQRR